MFQLQFPDFQFLISDARSSDARVFSLHVCVEYDTIVRRKLQLVFGRKFLLGAVADAVAIVFHATRADPMLLLPVVAGLHQVVRIKMARGV